MTNIPHDVSARSVRASTRALFMIVAATIAPLLAQHLFLARRVQPETLGAFALAGALTALIVSRGVVARDGATRSGWGVFAQSVAGGLVGGALTGLIWVQLERPSEEYGSVLGLFFGGLYGSGMGALLGIGFGLWARRARAALDRPSVLASYRLFMEAGFALSLAGVLAFALSRVNDLSLLALAVTLVGMLVTIVGIAGAVRLQRTFASITSAGSDCQVTRKTSASFAPALVWAPVLDHVVVRTGAVAPVEPGLFRAAQLSAEVALVPADLSLVRKAIGVTVAFGLVAVSASVFLQAGALLLR